MAKRYTIIEEDTDKGTRAEVGKADHIHIDSMGHATVRGYMESKAPYDRTPARDSKPTEQGGTQNIQPVQIEAGNQVITITIQIAPAHSHHHGHGGCADCNRRR